MNNQQFTIKGLDCPDCARSVERGVARLEGVKLCSLNFTTETLHVTGDVDPEAVIARVRELGYEVERATAAAVEPPPTLLRF
ncbi:MAG: heavy-metal-associated domain-containing protein, partial [Chloroflexus sp.]|nr:heavy-metal-associated domain-containing protein [Chloroflexus sp.]